MRRGDEQEWSRFYRLGGPFPVEALHARFVRHRYCRHAHEYLVVGLVESGVQSYTCRGSRRFTPAGRVFLLNPDVPHTGEAAVPDGYTYRTLYPRAEHLSRVAEQIGARQGSPFLKDAVVDDPLLATLLRRFHESLAGQAPTAECEWRLLEAVTCLLTRHGQPRVTAQPAGNERRAAHRAADYLQTHFAQDVSLRELAAAVGLSPYYFARSFQKAFGLPPHAYLESVRIRSARRFLDDGQTPVAAALAAGYADQSHLTRRFKGFLGMTPGQYQREGKIRQD